MIEMEFIALEDGLEYGIVDEIIINDTKYLYLVEENSNKVELRKLDSNNDLIKIISKQEYDKAIIEFAKRHKNDFV